MTIPFSYVRPLVIAVASALWIIVLCVALQNPENSVKLDSQGYLVLADNLWKNGVFSASLSSPFLPETLRLPGYPLILGFFSSLLQFPVRALIAIHWLWGVCTVILLHWWIRRSASENSIIWLFGAFACDLVILLHTVLIMTEALYLLALTITILITYKFISNQKISGACFAGICWGALVLIKPITILFPVFACGVFLSRPRIRMPLFLIFAYLPAGIWATRNHVAVGEFVISTQGGIDFLRYPAASIEALRLGTEREAEEARLREMIDARFAGEGATNVTAKRAEYGRVAFEIMKNHPVLTLRYCASGALRILAGPGVDMIPDLIRPNSQQIPSDRQYHAQIRGDGTLRTLIEYPWATGLLLIYLTILAATYIFYLRGLIALWNRRNKALAFFLLIGPAYILLISCHQGYYRYRIPIMPFLLLGITAVNGRSKI